MTCEEVQKITSEQNPEDVTRAVRAAIVAHCNRCPKCDRLIRQDAEKCQAKMTPEQRADVQKRAKELLESDMGDEEYRATTEG